MIQPVKRVVHLPVSGRQQNSAKQGRPRASHARHEPVQWLAGFGPSLFCCYLQPVWVKMDARTPRFVAIPPARGPKKTVADFWRHDPC